MHVKQSLAGLMQQRLMPFSPICSFSFDFVVTAILQIADISFAREPCSLFDKRI